MSIKVCVSCSKSFPAVQGWEKKCLICWKEENGYSLAKGDLAFREMQVAYEKFIVQYTEIRAERDTLRRQREELEEELDVLAAEVKRLGKTAKANQRTGKGLSQVQITSLLKLCHPDRHNNSAASTAATKWLLAQRKKK